MTHEQLIADWQANKNEAEEFGDYVIRVYGYEVYAKDFQEGTPYDEKTGPGLLYPPLTFAQSVNIGIKKVFGGEDAGVRELEYTRAHPDEENPFTAFLKKYAYLALGGAVFVGVAYAYFSRRRA